MHWNRRMTGHSLQILNPVQQGRALPPVEAYPPFCIFAGFGRMSLIRPLHLHNKRLERRLLRSNTPDDLSIKSLPNAQTALRRLHRQINEIPDFRLPLDLVPCHSNQAAAFIQSCQKLPVVQSPPAAFQEAQMIGNRHLLVGWKRLLVQIQPRQKEVVL